jgi:hypothetical protein
MASVTLKQGRTLSPPPFNPSLPIPPFNPSLLLSGHRKPILRAPTVVLLFRQGKMLFRFAVVLRSQQSRPEALRETPEVPRSPPQAAVQTSHRASEALTLLSLRTLYRMQLSTLLHFEIGRPLGSARARAAARQTRSGARAPELSSYGLDTPFSWLSSQRMAPACPQQLAQMDAFDRPAAHVANEAVFRCISQRACTRGSHHVGSASNASLLRRPIVPTPRAGLVYSNAGYSLLEASYRDGATV